MSFLYFPSFFTFPDYKVDPHPDISSIELPKQLKLYHQL